MSVTNNFDILSYPSRHYSSRNGVEISAIIAHSVGVPLLRDVFSVFEQYQVSAHYLIPQITTQELIDLMPDIFGNSTIQFPNAVPVIQLVDDSNKAFHAGVSSFSDWNNQPECAKGLSAATVGIEFHAPGYANGDGSDWYKFVPYTNGQIDTGIKLFAYLMEAHAIPKQNLLAHSTISVGRKTDPGPLFPWKAFSDQGLGYLPQPKDGDVKVEQSEETIKFVQSKLSEIGFVLCPNSTVLDAATQNHIDAYVMQFATELWTGNNVAITQELVDSLNGFNATISSLPLVGVEAYSDGITLAA